MSEAAFFAAIRAQPEADAPRLVFADWLDEHGQPERAEFIRRHIAWECGANDYANEERIYDLVEAGRAAWTQHLPQAPGVEWYFRRGLPEYLDIDADGLLAEFAHWTALPDVRYVGLGGCTFSTVSAFAAQPWPARWIGLHLFEEPRPWLHSYPHEPARDLQALVQAPQAQQLRELGIHYYSWSEAMIAVLCSAPHLRQIERLYVGTQGETDARLSAHFGARLRHGELGRV
jgi:uncharacterized protein (TIGR02996 family)